MNSQTILRDKLRVFTRRYYQNRLLKGAIYSAGIGIGYFILIALLEVYGRFPGSVRIVLFWLLVLGLSAILVFYIFIPLLQLIGIGKRISDQKAAQIIGRHFPEVDDKLVNTIQLQVNSSQNSLIAASIDQRISQLKPIPFQTAVNFRDNLKYWPVLVVPVLAVVIFLASGLWPQMTDATKRIRAYNEEFIPEAPFQFVINNDLLAVEEGEDFELKLSFEGNSIPAEVELLLPGGSARMVKNNSNEFIYQFENVRNEVPFKFAASGFSSGRYVLEVIPVPRLADFKLEIQPPSYTGAKPSVTEVEKQHQVLEGSLLKWRLRALNTDTAYLTSDTVLGFTANKEAFEMSQSVSENFNYDLISKNAEIVRHLVSNNSIKVIKDQSPEIKVEWQRDSVSPNLVYYTGQIADDYGFSGLRQVVEVDEEPQFRSLPFKRINQQRFSGVIALDSLLGDSSRAILLKIQVFDNDAVNGAKMTTSNAFRLNLKGLEEREEQLQKDYNSYFESSEEEIKKQKSIEELAESLKREMANKKSLDWKQKSQLKKLMQKQQELLKKQQENKERLEEISREEENLNKDSEELKKKEEAIEKLTEENKELQELMDELEKLMEELDTQKLQKKLEEFQKEAAQQQQEMQREMSMMKDLKFQRDILREAQKLEKLSKEMDELSESEKEASEKAEDQKELEKKFEESKESIEDLKKQNESFKKETENEKLEEQAEEVEQNMEESQQQLDQNNDQKAGESQKKASEQMQKMAESLQMAMMNMGAQRNKENIETLRQILENLETLSFNIEALADQTVAISVDDPAFKTLLTEQRRMQEGSEIIRDSLTALANRVPEVKQTVFEELGIIDQSLGRGIHELEEVNTAKASVEQQEVMTSANNLALLLDEAMQQMLQQQAQMMPGSQSCQKPGNKPSSSGAKKLMKKLSEQMGKAKQGQKKGKEGKKGKGTSGKELVEMMSRQEQLRQAIEEMKGEGSSGSKGDLQKALDELEKLEQDLLDGQLEDNYLERLAEIETRLLEHEKAELEQKKDKKRESKTADNISQIRQEELEKYLQEKQTEVESIYRNKVDFNPYYKSQSSKYLK